MVTIIGEICAMWVRKINHYMLDPLYVPSTIIIVRTHWTWWCRSIWKDNLGYCQRKCEPCIKCTLSHSQSRVHWSQRLNTALGQLTDHSGTLKQCHSVGKPQFHFLEFLGKLNIFNKGNLVFADVLSNNPVLDCNRQESNHYNAVHWGHLADLQR